MTKKEIVTLLAEKLDDIVTSKTAAESVYDRFCELIAEQLKEAGEFSLAGIGNFTVANRAARGGVNPRTGDKIQIKARKAVKFKCSRTIKESLNS